jgi:hypothetical protein
VILPTSTFRGMAVFGKCDGVEGVDVVLFDFDAPSLWLNE